jgi:hypothetical protein
MMLQMSGDHVTKVYRVCYILKKKSFSEFIFFGKIRLIVVLMCLKTVSL